MWGRNIDLADGSAVIVPLEQPWNKRPPRDCPFQSLEEELKNETSRSYVDGRPDGGGLCLDRLRFQYPGDLLGWTRKRFAGGPFRWRSQVDFHGRRRALQLHGGRR